MRNMNLKNQSTKLWLVTCGLFISVASFAIECSPVNGQFSCPQYGSDQPPMTLTRVSTLLDQGQTMMIKDTWASATDFNHQEYFASVSGMIVDGEWLSKCDLYRGKPALLFFKANEVPELKGTYTFINDQNNLEAVVGGKTVIICTRIQ